MSGMAMLWMIATTGITYGWVPDGSDGVRYIVQVSPSEMGQLARVGEVSSKIDPLVQGRVSEVVIRVGDAVPPRITPKFLQTGPATRAVTGADAVPMPIPSIATDARSLPNRDGDNRSSTAVMKPAPQSGGMNLPGSFSMPSTAPATAGDPRISATPTLDPRSRDSLVADPRAAASLDPRMAASGGNQLRNAASDPRQRLQVPSSPSTATVPPPALANEMRVGDSQYSIPAIGNRGVAVDRLGRTGTLSDDADWYTQDERPRRRLSTAPIDPNDIRARETLTQPGVAGTNWGRLPGGLPTRTVDASPGATPLSTPDPTNRYANGVRDLVDPRLTPAQAAQLPPGGYSFDVNNQPVDREGYRIDANGRRLVSNATSSPPGFSTPTIMDNSRFPTSQWPDRVADRFGANSGAPPTGTYPTVAAPIQSPTTGIPYREPARVSATPPYVNMANSAVASPNATIPNFAAPTGYGTTYPSSAGPTAMTGPSPTTAPGTPPGYAPTTQQVPPSMASASVTKIPTPKTTLDGLPPSRSSPLDEQTVAAQPLFNVMLLMSIVGNFYLLYWLKNLRLQFRDMVASKRNAASGGIVASA
ncbi:MAG: hypothetical protein AAF670_08225 [Planctomycetota bacterium]